MVCIYSCLRLHMCLDCTPHTDQTMWLPHPHHTLPPYSQTPAGMVRPHHTPYTSMHRSHRCMYHLHTTSMMTCLQIQCMYQDCSSNSCHCQGNTTQGRMPPDLFASCLCRLRCSTRYSRELVQIGHEIHTNTHHFPHSDLGWMSHTRI